MRASDQQSEGLSAHPPWRSVIAPRCSFKSASFAAVRATSNAGSGGSSSIAGTIPRKISRDPGMLGDDQRQPGERVQNLQQQH